MGGGAQPRLGGGQGVADQQDDAGRGDARGELIQVRVRSGGGEAADVDEQGVPACGEGGRVGGKVRGESQMAGPAGSGAERRRGFAAAKQVEVEAADNAIERRLIRSPIDGVVVDVAKHEGEWMQPGDTLAHVVRTDKLRVEGYVKIREALPAAVENRPVTVVVELDGGRREQFQGRIAFVKPVVESGDYRVFAEVENRRDGGEWLLPAGQTAVMTIHLDAAAAPAGR